MIKEEGMVTTIGPRQMEIMEVRAKVKIHLASWARISFKAFRVSDKNLKIEFAHKPYSIMFFIWFKISDSFWYRFQSDGPSFWLSR